MQSVRQEGKSLVTKHNVRFSIVTREAFADFLDRYADNRTGELEWQRFIIQHYSDSFLEETRRCVARLATNMLPIHGDTEAALEIVHSWAFLLRSSTNSSVDHKPDVATIDMTPSEAVLLDSILRRYSESNMLTIENAAEQQCLWNIQCLLEKHGDQPAWPCLDEATAKLSPQET